MTKPLAVARAPELDNSRSYMGNLMSFLLRGHETSGRFSVTEATGRIGNEPPPHIHLWEDEIYYILEGSAEFFVEGMTDSLRAESGSVVFLPQGKAHAIYFRSEVFRTLIMVQATDDRPVGTDAYFHDMSKPARNMGLPDDALTYAAGTAEDLEEAAKAALARGIRMLDPAETATLLPNYSGLGANLE